MSWYNFVFAGSATIQTDDAETSTISETGTTAVALAQSIRLTDIVLSTDIPIVAFINSGSVVMDILLK